MDEKFEAWLKKELGEAPKAGKYTDEEIQGALDMVKSTTDVFMKGVIAYEKMGVPSSMAMVMVQAIILGRLSEQMKGAK